MRSHTLSQSVAALVLGMFMFAAISFTWQWLGNFESYRSVIAVFRPEKWTTSNAWRLWPLLALDVFVAALIAGGAIMLAVAWMLESWGAVFARITAISAAVIWVAVSIASNTQYELHSFAQYFWYSLYLCQALLIYLVPLVTWRLAIKVRTIFFGASSPRQAQ